MPSCRGSSQLSSWFNCLHPRAGATVRLICFPWSAGGSQFYARWGADFGPAIEVVGIRLPGRETRCKEPCASDFTRLVQHITEEIMKHYAELPFVFFGHSMGCYLAYETAKYMKETFSMEPAHIFFSGAQAPNNLDVGKKLKHTNLKPFHECPDDVLIKRIESHGGTPKTFLENLDFMKKVFLPIYRADLKLMYRHYCSKKGESEKEVEALTCNITAIQGDRDKQNMEEYKEITTGKFDDMTLTGGHFYILKYENIAKLRVHITKEIL